MNNDLETQKQKNKYNSYESYQRNKLVFISSYKYRKSDTYSNPSQKQHINNRVRLLRRGGSSAPAKKGKK